ncbi:MAG: DUF3108 domain-containing protein [Deltaproteobacteria bacterium]|nr:DUF3108 domain-containing protein [Deltaproteobacteria bacterium]
MKQPCARTHYRSLFKQLIIIPIMIISLVPFCLTEHTNALDGIPFHQGEKLKFRAQWGFLPAGEVILEVLPTDIINGVPSYHFAMITKTNKYIDLFYKIRERQDSYIDKGLTHSILYKKRSEGKHPRDVVVNFDWEKKEAAYSSFGEKMRPVSILPSSFDPLSLLYVIRLHQLAEGKVIEIPVTDGKRCIDVKVKVSKKEIIILAGKEYETYLVESDLETIGDIGKEADGDNLKIWFTANERKIPVRIKNKAGIGSFIFELIALEN